MLPAFRAGLQQAAIQEGVEGILAAIDNTYRMVERPRERPWRDRSGATDGGKVIAYVILFVMIAVFVVLFKRVARTANVGYGDDGRRRHGWRSDDDWGHSSRSSSLSGFSSRSSGGGGFRGGGASGRW
jgi:uncharacterized membrane protein YgcG